MTGVVKWITTSFVTNKVSKGYCLGNVQEESCKALKLAWLILCLFTQVCWPVHWTLPPSKYGRDSFPLNCIERKRGLQSFFFWVRDIRFSPHSFAPSLCGGRGASVCLTSIFFFKDRSSLRLSFSA